MPTHLKIYYTKSDNNIPGPILKRLTVLEDKLIQVKIFDGAISTIQDLDFRQSKDGYGASPNAYEDVLYEYDVVGDDLYAKIAAKVEELPEEINQHMDVTTFPQVIYEESNDDPNENVPAQTPDWVPSSTYTYAEKQNKCVIAIEAMLSQKERDIVMAGKALDLDPDLPKHVAYWWRSAVAVIKMFFQDPDTDPLIVAEMAKQAAAGPTTKSDQLTLLRNLSSLSKQYPSGPDFAAIWVETRNLKSPEDVVRKTMLDVLKTRGTQQDETYDLPTDFDSTDESWIVENQPGIISYDNDSPAINSNVEATLTDFDGGLSQVIYQWQQFQNGIWSDISGATNQSYTIISAGDYRCKINYTDNYGPNQEALGSQIAINGV